MKSLPDASELAAALAAVRVPAESELSDSALADLQRVYADIRRTADVALAQLASMVVRRSRPELGYAGLAQRTGARTPEQVVQLLTGVSRREAGTLVRVGQLMDADRDARTPAHAPSWMHLITAAALNRSISTTAADVIRGVLTSINADDGVLAQAASELIRSAGAVSIERLSAQARQLRDRLDPDGVWQREQGLREKRYLHFFPQADGMTRMVGLLDPESAAEIRAAVDAATSPRRGGPRFVSKTERERARRLLQDPRTTAQIAVDAVVSLVTLGVSGESVRIVGAHRPAVRLHVTAADLDRRAGSARLEGQTAAVSIATAQRRSCSDGLVPILFDADGQVLNVGRTQRFFTVRQRIALDARDGGCRFPGCDRPPGWTEAHHIHEWKRDHGMTDVADGILLCRHHYLLVHNNGWRVVRRGTRYLVVPPRSLDARQRPIPAPPQKMFASRGGSAAMPLPRSTAPRG